MSQTIQLAVKVVKTSVMLSIIRFWYNVLKGENKTSKYVKE